MADDRAPFRSILTTLPFTLVSFPLSPIFAPYSQNARPRADLLNSLRFNFSPSILRPPPPLPPARIVNNPSLKRGAKGMDVCTCFHGQRNDENHELSAIGQCSMLHPPCFTAPPRVINRGWPA